METKKRLKNACYIPGFEGIRTLAVLGVIFYHLIPNRFPGGFLGVILFFALSGYLITDLFQQELLETRRIDVLAFYQRRLKRLYPLLISVMLVITTYITLFQRSLLNNLRGAVLSSLLYFNNFWQIIRGDSYFDRFGNESPLTHIWALSIEGQFYLIWPIVFIVLVKLVRNNKRSFQILSGLALLSAILMAVLFRPTVDPSRVYYGTDTRAFSIFLGAALAFVWPSWKLKRKIPRNAKNLLDYVGLGSLGVIVLSILFMQDTWSFVYRGGMFLISVAAVLLIGTVVHPASIMGKILSNPIFKYIGDRSYGIYLWQFPVMVFYEAKINVANNTVLHTIIELAIIFVLSELSFRFIEEPMRKYDYSRLSVRLKNLFKYPYFVLEKIPVYAVIFLFVISVVGLSLPGYQGVNPERAQIKETIQENANKAQQHQTEISRELAAANAPSVMEIDPDAQLDKRYDLSAAQVKAAANLTITGFGDSVMLAAAPDLQELFPKMYISADVGRQLFSSFEDLQKLKDEGKLADVVLVGLGTNGSWTGSQFDQFMSILGSERQVFWINAHVPTRRWQNTVNADLERAAQHYSNLHIIDWFDASQNHEDWFYSDQVHPNEKGSPYYVKTAAHVILNENIVQKVQEQLGQTKETTQAPH